ncbi:hypothetical protein PG984_008147 [Apiospora sp. TS-2023a]
MSSLDLFVGGVAYMDKDQLNEFMRLRIASLQDDEVDTVRIFRHGSVYEVSLFFSGTTDEVDQLLASATQEPQAGPEDAAQVPAAHADDRSNNTSVALPHQATLGPMERHVDDRMDVSSDPVEDQKEGLTDTSSQDESPSAAQTATEPLRTLLQPNNSQQKRESSSPLPGQQPAKRQVCKGGGKAPVQTLHTAAASHSTGQDDDELLARCIQLCDGVIREFEVAGC